MWVIFRKFHEFLEAAGGVVMKRRKLLVAVDEGFIFGDFH
jgi:hypothetical protein